MAPAFSKEAILQGSVDHMCLVCESYLRSEREVCLHVATPAHSQNLDNADYEEKYKHDGIRKVKNRYFCEFCNVLVITRAAVINHVEDLKHEQNKSIQMIARVDDVIVSGNISIQEGVWHGFIDKSTCTVCNVDCQDRNVHKNEPNHVINLIQSKVSYINNSVYRKIDDSTFHCLTCNEVVAEITAHIEGTYHKKIIQNCTSITSSEGNEAVKKTSDNYYDEIGGNKTFVEDSVQQYNKIEENVVQALVLKKLEQKPALKVVENNVRKHKEDGQENNIEILTSSGMQENSTIKNNETFLTSATFENNKSENTENVETTTKETADRADYIKDINEIAEERGLIYNPYSNKLHCHTCNVRIPTSLKNINEHVNGKSHNQIVKSLNKPKIVKLCSFPRVPTIKFIRTLGAFNNFRSQEVHLNKKYCINYHCFTFLSKIEKGHFKCQVCEVDVRNRDMKTHVTLSRHLRALLEVPVILWRESEFIREIRSGIFQCGFCNIIDLWEGMENHVKSTDHERNKIIAGFRIRLYLQAERDSRIEYELVNSLYAMINLNERF